MAARFTLVLLGIATLAACDEAPVQEGATVNQAEAPVAAQPAAYPYAELAGEFAKMDAKYPRQDFYPAHYHQAKLAAGLEAEEVRPLVQQAVGDDPVFDLMTCSSEGVYAYTLGDDGDAAPYDELAKVTVTLQRSFLASGFSPDVFGEPMRNFERRMLEAIRSWPRVPLAADGMEPEPEGTQRRDRETAVYQALLKETEANRVRLAPNLPRIIYEGGCGAGEAPVTIRSDPPRATVWLIRAFDFYKCGLRTPNPWDPGACPWVEVNAGEETDLSGRYFYRAVWPDGRSRRGNHAFEYSEGLTEEATDVFTVRL